MHVSMLLSYTVPLHRCYEKHDIGDFIYNRANIGIFMSLVIGDVSRTEGFFQALGIQ